jgi:hypothetical protein
MVVMERDGRRKKREKEREIKKEKNVNYFSFEK